MLSLALVLCCVPTARAGELLPADVSIPRAIDHYIEAELGDRQMSPASPATDIAVLRRTALDLAGRIPTLAEVDDYERQSPSDKRERLVERLLRSPDFALHLRNEWDALLVSERESTSEWREYLLSAAKENRPWDQVFSDMLVAKEDDPARRGALQFLKSRGRDLDAMTNDTSVLFFGVNMSCAKCHDHPLVEDWRQDHYFGLTAFFARTYVTKSKRLAEKSTAEVKFKTTKGEEKTAALMFLSGATVDELVVERKAEERKAEEEEFRRQQKEDLPPPPPPAFSPRMELVGLVLKPDNRRFFARNAVNRTWARFFGRGLVHPLDQMHSNNTASHPELLDWLERDFIEHGYDLGRLIRGIALSEAYSRSSAWSGNGPTPDPEKFAFMATRPLTPKQLALSLSIATGNPQQFTADLESPQWSGQRQNLESQSNGFANFIEQPGEHFQVSVTEALLFANGERVQNEYLRDSGDRLVGVLKTESDEQTAIARAFRMTIARDPQPEELFTVKQYLESRRDRPTAGWQQLVWALVTSPEFRFNH
jgi:hypothetical protein